MGAKLKRKLSDLFERPPGGERAVLVHINFPKHANRTSFDEFCDLARSAGGDIAATVRGSRNAPDSKYFIGAGKAQEVKDTVIASDADLVLFGHPLTPSQERNLESLLQCRVLDRVGLILDIFAKHARTFEGKLQVELAQLQHLSTRLVRGWAHLERQKGGIGLRGPGEKQLETDRRLIRSRIKTIKSRLEKVRKQRNLSRMARKRANVPTVSLVGYTNAGKSTLFNYMTTGEVFVADQLFATLDPTLRKIQLPQIGKIILADTVGFISELPHDLVNAFHATLEEICEADLLLHIVDASSDERKHFINEVNQVLKDIDALTVRQLIVYNKIDLIKDGKPRIDRDSFNHPCRVWVSALTGEGIELLQQALIELFSPEIIQCDLVINPSEGKLRAELFRLGVIVSEHELSEGGWHVSLRILSSDYERLIVQN